MFTIAKVKETLNDMNLSNEKALEIRDLLYGLAEMALENWQLFKKTKASYTAPCIIITFCTNKIIMTKNFFHMCCKQYSLFGPIEALPLLFFDV